MTARAALVWGASGGIGRALVAGLVGDGWQVAAISRRASVLDSLTAWNFEADVSDAFAVQRAAMAAGQELGEAALFVYAAGDITSQPVSKMTAETWSRIINANLTGAYHATHASLPYLLPDAPLIFIGAVSERLRLPGLSAYAAAKAGLEAFAEVLRKEERGRRIILVRPSAVRTALWEKVPFRMPGNALEPEALARAVLEAYRTGYQGVLDL